MQPLGFIKDLNTPNKNSTVCFGAPVAQPVAPVAVNVPVAVPRTENINPVSAANSETKFIAILGFLAALVLAMF